MTEPNRWAFVAVSRSRTAPEKVIVNVYGYPTKGQAHTARRNAVAALDDADWRDRIIAARVRPIIDDDYLAALNDAPLR